MKTIILLVAVTTMLVGCSSVSSVIITDVEGEYIIVGRDLTPIFSLQKDAERNAIAGAIEFCKTLGKEYTKKYVVTTGMLPGKPADATLHFRCVETASSLDTTATDYLKK